MKTLRETDSYQFIDFAPRKVSENMVAIVIDDQTKEIVNTFDSRLIGSLMNMTWEQISLIWDEIEYEWEFPPIDPEVGNYSRLTGIFNLKEYRYYDFSVYVGDEEVYKDKIFCTNQPISQASNEYYSVSKGLYKTYNKETSNGYILP